MKILSHRGYWKTAAEKNTPAAFERSFSLGFGTETDIRDYGGELVISHDIADAACISVAAFFEIYNRYDTTLPLALNIKSDGLQAKLKALIDRYGITNYFVFDMSVPDGLQYLKHGLNAFTRQSEYETAPSFYGEAAGIWLDEFTHHWIDGATLDGHLARGKAVCIVSPDLHKRPYREVWEDYKRMAPEGSGMMLCTDYPEEARECFNA